jgi:hypothetical protein
MCDKVRGGGRGSQGHRAVRWPLIQPFAAQLAPTGSLPSPWPSPWPFPIPGAAARPGQHPGPWRWPGPGFTPTPAIPRARRGPDPHRSLPITPTPAQTAPNRQAPEYYDEIQSHIQAQAAGAEHQSKTGGPPPSGSDLWWDLGGWALLGAFVVGALVIARVSAPKSA